MTTTKITQLPALTTALDGTEEFEIARQNVSRRLTSQNLFKTVGVLPSTGGNPVPLTGYRIPLYRVSDGEPFSCTLSEALTSSGNIPAGGTTGQVLTKASDADFNTAWTSAALPPGGTQGQILSKASGTDYDVHWVDDPDAPVAANTVLAGPTSGGDANPTFRSLVNADLPTVSVDHGGTGLTSTTEYAVIVGGTSPTGALQSVDSVGSAGQALISNGAGAKPSFQNLSTAGQALTKADDTNVTLTLNGSPATALLAATSIAVGWTGQLSVPRGGTGASTLTQYGVLLGNGTGSISATAAGTTGYALIGNGSSNPTFQGFLASGTGAIERTWLSKMRDFVSVKDFGAVGDGVADDTAAIQDAFDNAMVSKRALFFPAGTYKITSTLTAYRADPTTPNGFRLCGEGSDQSIIITNASTGSAIAIGNDEDTDITQSRFVYIEGLSIIGPNGENWASFDGAGFIAGTGLQLMGLAWSSLSDVYIAGFTRGLDIAGCLTCEIESSVFRLNIEGVNIRNTNASGANALSFYNVEIGLNRDNGMTATGASALRYDGGAIEGNGLGALFGYGCYLQDLGVQGGSGAFFNGTWFEANKGQADILINQTAYPTVISVQNCAFQRLDSADYTDHNIRVTATTHPFRMYVVGCAFFGAGSYVANASRQYISTSGSSGDWFITADNSNYWDSATETPTVGDLQPGSAYSADSAGTLFYPQKYDADLQALADNSTNGVWARTGSGTGAARTITGTANEITATNGDGVAGNPTLSLPSALTFTGKTVTGGTFASPTLTTPVLGTPSSGTLTNCTGLPVATGISGLGTGVGTFLATPTFANLASAVTGGAWTSFTPSVTAAVGTFTSVSADGRYVVFGKTCTFSVLITFTTVGTGSYPVMGLPFTSANDGVPYGGSGRNTSTGELWSAFIDPNVSTCGVARYDSGGTVADGQSIVVTGTYQIA